MRGHKTCIHCGSHFHPDSYHTEKYINDKGFPKSSKNYPTAHEEADKAEKKAFPKGYEKMKKVDVKLGKHELAGKNSKTGAISVSKRVPADLRREVSMHEKQESKNLKRLKKK